MQGIRAEFLVISWSGDEDGFIKPGPRGAGETIYELNNSTFGMKRAVDYVPGRSEGGTFEITIPWEMGMETPIDTSDAYAEAVRSAYSELENRSIVFTGEPMLISIYPTTIDDIENPVDFSRFDFLDD